MLVSRREAGGKAERPSVILLHGNVGSGADWSSLVLDRTEDLGFRYRTPTLWGYFCRKA